MADALNRIKELYGSVLTRLGLGAGALVAFWAWQEDGWSLVAGAAFALAVLLWVGAEIASAADKVSSPKQPHPHDLDLFKKLKERFTADFRRYVRETDFAGGFFLSLMRPIYDFGRDWAGADHEFVDPELQAALVAVRSAAEDLVSGLILNAHPSRNNADFMTTRLEHEGYNAGPDRAAALEKLNEQAEGFCKALDDFEREARARLNWVPT